MSTLPETTYVYILTTDGRNYKLGLSNDLADRQRNLQTGNPEELQVFSVIKCPSRRVASAVEKHIERKLKGRGISKTRKNGEWYKAKDSEMFTVVFETVVRDSEIHAWNLKRII